MDNEKTDVNVLLGILTKDNSRRQYYFSDKQKLALVECLQIIALFDSESTEGIFPLNTKNYLSQAEHEQLVKLRTVESMLLEVIRGFGGRYETADTLLRFALKQVFKVVEGRLGTLSKETRMIQHKRFENLTITVQAACTDRFMPDQKDDLKVNVATDDLYDVAELAISECNKKCDGKKEECEIRRKMQRMGVPKSYNDDNCQYCNK